MDVGKSPSSIIASLVRNDGSYLIRYTDWNVENDIWLPHSDPEIDELSIHNKGIGWTCEQVQKDWNIPHTFRNS